MIEEVTFYSDGFKLRGNLHLPNTTKGREAAIIVCYGYADFKDAPWVYELCSRLCDMGLIALRFDYRCSGLSEGMRGRLICLEQVRDIRNAITFLKAKYVKNDMIGLLGYSLGGANVIQTAAVDKRVKFVISVAGIGDGGRWLYWIFRQNKGEEAWNEFLKRIEKDRENRVLTGKSEFLDSHTEIVPSPPEVIDHVLRNRKEFPPPKGPISKVSMETAESIMEHRPENDVDKISCPTLWIHGDADTLVPVTESISMYSKAKCSKKLIIIPGADHLLLSDPSKKVFDYIVDIIEKWLTELDVISDDRSPNR